MRKLFTYFTVAALVAVACDNMYGPVETPVAPDKAGSVEIKVDTLGDDTLAFTLAPVGEASYYSYFVAAGPAQAVDSASVYECAYDAMIKGSFKASEVADTTLTLGELSPNTAYTIYAVAGSPQGHPGSVSVKEVVTTDGVTIALLDYDAEVTDSSIVFTFSEKVFLGKGEITARYFAINDPDIRSDMEKGVLKAVADSIVVEGNTVTVQFAGLPNGAYYTVCWPEGMFTDSANNKIKELKGGFTVGEKGLAPYGVYSRKDTVAFALVDTLATEQEMFTDWKTALFSVEAAVDSTLATIGGGEAVVNYVTPGKVLSIDLEFKKSYTIIDNAVIMACPEDPLFGTNVVFSFEQDAFQDIWGNPTKEVDLYTLCAYDYTLESVIGYYDVTYYSYFYGESYGYESSAMKIEALEDSEYGNVMITLFQDIECETPIVATFNPQAGTLTIPSGQYFTDGYDYVYGEDGRPVAGADGEYLEIEVQYVFEKFDQKPLVIQMTKDGELSYSAANTNGLFGVREYYQGEPYNYYDMIQDFSAKKGEEPVEEEPVTQSVKRVVRKLAL